MPSKNPYQEFLEQKHQNFNTSQAILNQLVLKASHSPIVSFEKVIQGETNEVYRIKTLDNQELIIRISHREDRNFEQERWAQDKCSQKGVPTAKILLIKHLNLNNEKISVCVMQKLAGVTLDNRTIIPSEEDKLYLNKICLDAGKILSRIHSVKTTKFGELNDRGEGQHNNFKNLFEEKLDQKKLFNQIISQYDISASIMNQIFSTFEQNLNLLDIRQSVLVHSDFGPKHIMVDNDQITGIIDFGEAQAGHPLQDFAGWDFWYSHQIPTETLMEKYEDKAIFTKNYQEILKSIVYLYYLNTLYHYDNEKNTHMVMYITQKLQKYL